MILWLIMVLMSLFALSLVAVFTQQKQIWDTLQLAQQQQVLENEINAVLHQWRANPHRWQHWIQPANDADAVWQSAHNGLAQRSGSVLLPLHSGSMGVFIERLSPAIASGWYRVTIAAQHKAGARLQWQQVWTCSPTQCDSVSVRVM